MVYWNDIEWEDEKTLNEYKKTFTMLLDYKLALENYEDFNHAKIKNFSKWEKMWYKRNSTCSSGADLLKLANTVLEGYKSLVNEIGIDKFLIYKNGGIEYRA